MAKEVSFDLTDKVVIVTGAGSGIGKVIAEVCAAYGADLAVGSRTVSRCEETAGTCRELGRRAEAWELDLTSVESIRRVCRQDTWMPLGASTCWSTMRDITS